MDEEDRSQLEDIALDGKTIPKYSEEIGMFEHNDRDEIFCHACNEIVLTRHGFSAFSKWYTVEEQLHLMTEEHKQLVILWKLSGDNT